MADRSLPDVTKTVKDAAYITVGLGVIGFQRLQVQRNELEKNLRSQVSDARNELKKASGSFDAQIKTVEDRVTALETQIASVLDQLQDKLPDQAADIVSQARAAAKEAREQVRGLVNRAA